MNPPARDPVCGMNVNPATAKHIHDHQGTKFYFCCAGCLEKFKADPAKYLDQKRLSGLVTLGAAIAPAKLPHQHPTPPTKAEKPPPGAAAAPAYVCPMCPEVRESKP
ncbi:MAG: YHS domain-containing protein, partial [Candidatus Sulfotelmatobacter sp.]